MKTPYVILEHLVQQYNDDVRLPYIVENPD